MGKTELAKVLARALNRELIRLQCYEGLDEGKALYEWEYGKQLLYTQILRDKIGEVIEDTRTLADAVHRLAKQDNIFFSREFILPRPLLRAILSPQPTVLLIDEIDKSDAEFEAFLLEVLSDFQVSVPELGTLRAVHHPWVVVTSNSSRELSDALRRRCLYLRLDFPDARRELDIIRLKVPGVGAKLAREVVDLLQKLRKLDMKKQPGISETLDWVRALILLNVHDLGNDLVEQSLSALMKVEADLRKARSELERYRSEVEAHSAKVPVQRKDDFLH